MFSESTAASTTSFQFGLQNFVWIYLYQVILVIFGTDVLYTGGFLGGVCQGHTQKL